MLVSGGGDGTIRVWDLTDGGQVCLLFDPLFSSPTEVRRVRRTGQKQLTVPCGSQLPPNATCLCDCVATMRSYPGPQMVCTCDTILVPAGNPLGGNEVCICDTISVGTGSAGIGARLGSGKGGSTSGSPSNTTTYTYTYTYYYTYYYTYWYPN